MKYLANFQRIHGAYRRPGEARTVGDDKGAADGRQVENLAEFERVCLAVWLRTIARVLLRSLSITLPPAASHAHHTHRHPGRGDSLLMAPRVGCSNMVNLL